MLHLLWLIPLVLLVLIIRTAKKPQKRVGETADPYDCSGVYRAWDKLREKKSNQVVSSRYQLESIARNDASPDVKIAAINQLNPDSSRHQLEDIARSASNSRVRAAAASKLIG